MYIPLVVYNVPFHSKLSQDDITNVSLAKLLLIVKSIETKLSQLTYNHQQSSGES